MRRSVGEVLALLPLLVLAASRPSTAAPGDLDPGFAGFGAAGKVEALGFDAQAATIDAEGRLVLVGNDGNTFYVQRRSGIAFENVEGVSVFVDGGQERAGAKAVAIAPDGKIVVAGPAVFPVDHHDFGVVRLNPDLTPDPDFSEGGTAFQFEGRGDDPTSVAIEPQSKRVVVGGIVEIDHILGPDVDFGIARLKTDGSLDPTFDGDGLWTRDDTYADQLAAVAVQPGDFKIVMAGNVYAGDNNKDFAVVRLNADGSADDNFGNGGEVQTDFGGLDVVAAMALLPGGNILVAGSQDSGAILLARYLPNGDLDPGFGGGGKVVIDPDSGSTVVISLVAQPDGKIVVAGRNAQDAPTPDRFLLLRLNDDGSRDPAFGIDGEVVTSFSGGADSEALGLALQRDGMLVAAGHDKAARYRWNGELDAGTATVVFDPGHIGSEARALAVQGGKLVAAGAVADSTIDMALARFQTDQSALDPTFGNSNPKDGKTLQQIAVQDEVINAMSVRSDGMLTVAGHTTDAINGQLMFVGRYKADGTPDIQCSGVGYARTGFDFGPNEGAAVAAGPNDTIYVAGTVRGPTGNDFGLVRFTKFCAVDKDNVVFPPGDLKLRLDLGADENLTGMVTDGVRPVLVGDSNGNIVIKRIRYDLLGRFQVDPFFGVGGTATLDLVPKLTSAGVAKQSDGSLIVAVTRGDVGSSDMAVVRFTSAGMLDTTFGDQGVAVANFNGNDTAVAVAVGNGDRIAVVGSTYEGNARVFAVAEFTRNGQPDTTFHGNGKTTLKLAADGEDVAQAVTFLGNQDLVVGGYSFVFGLRQFEVAEFQTAKVVKCGDFNEDGNVTASDALGDLRAAVGSTTCNLCVCDTDASLAIGASDALRVLRVAVGQPVTLTCPECS